MAEKKTKTDLELLVEILDEYEDDLSANQIAAFSEMRIALETGKGSFYPVQKVRGRPPRSLRQMPGLSPKQKTWLYGVAERLGIIGAAPSENLFSNMSPEKQAEQRARAAKVLLPWEK